MVLGPRRPLIGHLQTGQLNAVSMRVLGRSGAYLVVFEDQMPLFASKLSKAVAWAIPWSRRRTLISKFVAPFACGGALVIKYPKCPPRQRGQRSGAP